MKLDWPPTLFCQIPSPQSVHYEYSFRHYSRVMWSVEFFNLSLEHLCSDEYTVIGEGAFFVMKAPQNLCEAIMLNATGELEAALNISH